MTQPQRFPAPFRRARLGLLALALACASGLFAASSVRAQFTDFVIFGDSLSDNGNIADRTEDEIGVTYPGPDFGYTDGRFTDGKDTDPDARTRTGVWHEQLAKFFLHIPRAVNSLDGGSDYAFGGAKTINGQTKRAVVEDPIFGNEIDIGIDDMGKQVDDYLAAHVPSATSLFIVWGGSNDLLDNPDSATVASTAGNVAGLITRLAQAGARTFLVPNVPPLGMVPENAKTDKAAQLNAASAEYRDTLATALTNVQTTLASQGVTITIVPLDVYSLFLRLYAKPVAYGLINVTDASQDSSDANPDKYLSWDGLHPTTVGHYDLAAEGLHRSDRNPGGGHQHHQQQHPGDGGLGMYYLTRTGTDVSTVLKVPLTASGDAVAGVDYLHLPDNKRIKPNKAFVSINLRTYVGTANAKGQAAVLSIVPGDGYVVGQPGSATINIGD